MTGVAGLADVVTFTMSGVVAKAAIDNPPLNIIDAEVMGGLLSALSEAESDATCRAFILYAAGDRGFSAGASVAEHMPGQAEAMIAGMSEVLTRFHATPLLTVAAVHGLCLGGGAEVALACDFVIATEDSRIGIPEITIGCYPPFAMLQLPSLVGTRRAKEMILSGRILQAQEAEGIGLVNRLVERDQLLKSADDIITPILSHSPSIVSIALARMRQLDRRVNTPDYFEMGSHFLSDLLDHPDYIEGLTAFEEKREANWSVERVGGGGGG
ncbi:MAG TPA: enoyl-CoA hydratase/isomerase family protein [Candidatus Poseidoniales archaeon]|nr:enoyl-CoA hydratase/isomerase family protein [Candidatus Poseidoniales archaeon]